MRRRPAQSSGIFRGLSRTALLILLLSHRCHAALNVADGFNITATEVHVGQGTWNPAWTLLVNYTPALQPVVNVSIGGQWLQLVFDASSAYAVVFMKEFATCQPPSLPSCYSYKEAEKHGGFHVCSENNDPKVICDTRPNDRWSCTSFLSNVVNTTPHTDVLMIDGLEYRQRGIEGLDTMMMELSGPTRHIFSWSAVPVRLLTDNLTAVTPGPMNLSLNLFEGVDGILGGSGPTLSCRNTTLWHLLLQRLNATRFFLDFRAPPAALIQDPGQSQIVFNEVDPAAVGKLLWSQPKQTGDTINDAMHELLIYRPKVCGVDLLYNASSNWLTVVDTSGPCLALPPFLFDRVVTHIPVDCPFGLHEKSFGRLCSPRKVNGERVKLPVFTFSLQDQSEPSPPEVTLALERLVFRNESGVELVCLARQDTNSERVPADMMYSHIAFGSMVAAALYLVIDLENHTIGLASRGDAQAESSQEYCAVPETCIAMQSYFPPLNVCEDPPCQRYLFMTLDDDTKMCVWRAPIPMLFGGLMGVLVVLDLISHRLYKSAIQRASQYAQ